MSFRISVTPHRRAAARFVDLVRRKLQAAYADNPEVSQSAIADELGVHRSVINRQLRGYQDMSLGRVAELSWCLGMEPVFDLRKREQETRPNRPEPPQFSSRVASTQGKARIEPKEFAR